MNSRNDRLHRNWTVMKIFTVVSLLTLNMLTSYSQTKLLIGSLLSDRVQQQANVMGQAFLKGDYQTYARYTYPALLTAMGRESRMAATLTQTVNDMDAKGMSFSGIVPLARILNPALQHTGSCNPRFN